jgi:DNA-binding CsgD family transcriptional regulator
MVMLLEREAPLRMLNEALKAASAGRGRVALVSGEAGIGKTALIEQFTRALDPSIRTLWGGCDSLFTPRPLGPLLDMSQQIRGELRDLLRLNADRHAVFAAFLLELQRTPTIAVFEDVHWADESTLDLIKILARRVQRTSALIILTYRDDEVGAGHPLRMVLGDLPGATTDRLVLLPLTKAAVRSLATAAQHDVRANALFAATNGNPFFVTEILASQGEVLPTTVRDAVLTRAARLSPAAREVLQAAAIIGLRQEPWLLAQIAGAGVAVEECLAGGMLQAQGDAYAFRHELARQAILTTISPDRRMALHRRALALLLAAPTGPDLARLANHAEGTQDVSAVLEYAPAAARQAAAASSHREAIALFELALRFADSLPPAARAAMLDAYSLELWFPNRLEDGIQVLRQASNLWHALGDRLRECDSLVLLAENNHVLGRRAEAEQACTVALALAEAQPPSAELGHVYRVKCFMAYEDRDFSQAERWGKQAIAMAERFDDATTLARACNYMGAAVLVVDPERGRALMERSLGVGQAANLPFAIAGTITNWSQALVERCQFTEAQPYLKEGIAYATEHDDDYHLQELLTWQAVSDVYQGQWAKAEASLSEILQRPELDHFARIHRLLAWGRLHVRRGDPRAREVLDEALALSLEFGILPCLGPARTARAELAWLSGDLARARDEAYAAYDLAVQHSHPYLAGELALWRWRAGDPWAPPDWIAQPFALQIAGDWRAAAQAWEARCCPYEQGLALMDGDEAAQLASLAIFERLGAAPALDRSKQALRAQGRRGIPRGPRPATRENPFGLTTRELEVLGHLALGLSNNAIAQALSLSPRTVEHHVAAILHKLEAQSRAEAVALALQHALVAPE